MNDLIALRNGIDQVDAQIIRLFAQRMELARRVGEYKRARNLPVFDPERERTLIVSRVEQINDPALSGPVAELFETLMRLSKEAQFGAQQ
ncbi:MAG: chorismate mutase [Clostridia bacterium]|nr:chorismate mutase [Clostridia bacterium]